MYIKITIDMNNAAFYDEVDNGTEVARILQTVISNVRGYPLSPGDEFSLRDMNGNTCGIVEVKRGEVKL